MFSIKILCSHLYNSEAVAVTYSAKKVFLKISLGAESSVIDSRLKLQASPGFPLKRIIRHRCFLMTFAKFLRTRFFFVKYVRTPAFMNCLILETFSTPALRWL